LTGAGARLAVGSTVAAIVLAAATAAYAATSARPTQPQSLRQPAAPKQMTTRQALAAASATGRPVAGTGAAPATHPLSATPDGTLTMPRSVFPVRNRVGGGWANLAATLRANSDATFPPANTTNRLTLPGGGSGPLATIEAGGKSLALPLPMALPSPT